MENQVTVIRNAKSGLVFTPGTEVSKNGKTYGFYVLQQIAIVEANGFTTEDKRTAMQTVENSLGAKLNYSEGQVKLGKIAREESHTPFHVNDKPVINPETKAIVLRAGKSFYRKNQFTTDLTKQDDILARDVAANVAAQPAKVASGLAN